MYPCKECEKSKKDWVQIGLLIMYPCGKEIEKVVHIFKFFGRAYCNFFRFVVEWCCTKRNSFGGGFILNYKERKDWLIGREFPHSRNAHPQKDLFCRQLLGDRNRCKRESYLHCLMNSEAYRYKSTMQMRSWRCLGNSLKFCKG